MKQISSTLLLLIICLQVSAQDNDASTYSEPSEVKVGDIIILNEPSDPNYYRSAYFTFKAAKKVYPDVNADKYERVFLSYKFRGTPFKVSKIRKGRAMLAYGIMDDFAILDLELAIKSGELGRGDKIIPIWLANDARAGDSLHLKPIRTSHYQSVEFTPDVFRELSDSLKAKTLAVPANFKDTAFIITKVRRGMATIARDTVSDYAVVQLKRGIELEEIDIIENFIASRKTEEFVDEEVKADTIPSFFERIGVQAYIFPTIEIAGTENSSSFNYGGGLGVIIRNKYQVGGFIQIYDADLSKRIIFPNAFVLDYTYAGFFVAQQVYSRGPLNVLLEGKFATGEVAWSMAATNEVLDTDKFLMFNPRIGVDYKFTDLTILNISLGYRIVSNLNLIELEKTALNSLSLSATLKFGWFKQ